MSCTTIKYLNIPHSLKAAQAFINRYELQVKVVCSAAAAPNDLFAGDEGHEEVQTNLYDELGHHLGSIWNGEEERFMFNRAVSRLIEMQSEEYLQAPHKPN